MISTAQLASNPTMKYSTIETDMKQRNQGSDMAIHTRIENRVTALCEITEEMV